jgi:DNA gyrase subunit B
VAVNAVSSWLQIDSFRHGRRYSQRYERGHPITSLDDVGPTQRAGTRIAFLPDPMIFPDAWINPGAIAARLRELSWLLPSLALSFVDRREHRFHEPRGLRGFLDRAGAPGGSTDAEIFTVSAKHGAIAVEAAMRWYLHPWSSVESFANIERTTDGGTHVRGLLEGLADGLRAAAQPHPVGRKRSQLRRAVQQGLQAVVCVRLHDPTFGEPTRSRLVTPEAERAVRAVVAPAFEAALSHNGELLERFLKVLTALGAAG